MPASISVTSQFDTRYSRREVQIAKLKKCPPNQSALISIPLCFSRYVSSQGWAGGPYPISIPKSLRSALQNSNDTQTGGTGTARTSNWDNNTKKEARSVFDLVGHLCGRPVPGIPVASTLPSCPVDRVRQIHWMYCTLLTFLR